MTRHERFLSDARKIIRGVADSHLVASDKAFLMHDIAEMLLTYVDVREATAALDHLQVTVNRFHRRLTQKRGA